MLVEDLDVWIPSWLNLVFKIVDLVNAGDKLDSLDGETLLTLPFACSSMLLVTCLLAFLVVYTRL